MHVFAYAPAVLGLYMEVQQVAGMQVGDIVATQELLAQLQLKANAMLRKALAEATS